MINNELRTHDEFYAHEPVGPPKQVFVEIARSIADEFPNERIKVADIGCAVGAFPAYLNDVLPLATVTGVEYRPDLVKEACHRYPAINIIQGDVMDPECLTADGYEVCTLLGVHSIFDDVQPILENLMKWTKPGGSFFVFGMFNPHDVDVFVRYRVSSNPTNSAVETGWNVPSQSRVASILTDLGLSAFSFSEFCLSEPLLPRTGDPLRSWTIESGGRRYVTNGTCLLQPQFLLKVEIP